MGIVYEAEQDQPRRIVALKVIRPGLANSDLLRRFEQEANALGRLQHAGIAQIYEAGTANTGSGPQPYFAMELIRGSSLRRFAETHHLDTHQRLELVAKICDAVQHAHQRGIIHRDLKPSNILVDDTGQPKILDFGVAQVTDSDAHATRLTDVGRLIGTLAYMSPEQVLADPLELDTRTDIYALGVVLYELLAHRLPYTVSQNLPDAVRTIREQEPAPLRSTNRQYRGDIETIVAKALEKEKARRYASAAAFAADIRRYLRHEPISARPASATYQLQKFALRHKTVVVAAATAFVVLLGGIVASTREAIRARRAEQTAVAAEQTQQAVIDFLKNDLLAQASVNIQAEPNRKPDPDLKVRTALDRAALGIDRKFGHQPLVEASIRSTIGETYVDLGLFPAAERQLERALELRRSALGAGHSDTLTSMNAVAHLYELQARYAKAEETYTKVFESRRLLRGERDDSTLTTMNALADLYTTQGKYAQAEPLLVKYLENIRSVRGSRHRDVAAGMVNLAALYQAQAKYVQAEPLYTESLQIYRTELGAEHPDTLTAMNDLGLLYTRLGRFREAEPLYVDVLAAKQRLLGDDHSETLISMANLANLYARTGDYQRAEPLMIKSLEIRRRVLGENHPLTAVSMNNLAALYSRQGRLQEAGPLYEKVLETRTRLLGRDHPDTIQSMNNLAVQLRDEGRLRAAESLVTRAVEAQTRVLGAEDPRTLVYESGLATIYRGLGKYQEARALQTRTLDAQRRILGETHPETLFSLEELATLAFLEGNLSEAELVARRILAARQRAQGVQHPDTLRTSILLGRVLVGEHKYVDAEPLLRAVVDSYETITPEHWRRYFGQSLLGSSLSGQAKYADAEPLLLGAYQGLLQRQAAIPADSRVVVRQTVESIVELYKAWRQSDRLTAWREKLQKLSERRTETEPE